MSLRLGKLRRFTLRLFPSDDGALDHDLSFGSPNRCHGPTTWWHPDEDRRLQVEELYQSI